MKTKLFILLIMIAASVARLDAKFVQEVEMNDGTVLVGYIYKQIPGKNIVFHSNYTRKDPKARYVQHDKNYTLSWKDVKFIRRSSESDPSWCCDKVTLKNGTVYLGQIVEQQLGVSMTILLNETLKTVKVKNSDIKTSEKVVTNLNNDLWIDRQYTNQLRLNDNTVREGLIVLQYRGLKTDDCYLELLRASGYRERIYLPDIKEYVIQLR